MKPHKHAEIIKAWADGESIEWRAENGYEWIAVDDWPKWDNKREYRVKPVAPEWPETTLTDDALSRIGILEKSGFAERRLIANAAIAHSCETGQLVPADKVREIEAKARAEGIKEGRRKEQELRRHEVDFGAGYNRVGYDIGYQGRAQK